MGLLHKVQLREGSGDQETDARLVADNCIYSPLQINGFIGVTVIAGDVDEINAAQLFQLQV